jgi:hypothetical protein
VDWFLKSSGYPIHLEAKFRPSDWPAHTDLGTFQAIQGSLLGSASKKFPVVPKEALHVVGITGFADLTLQRVHEFGRELGTHPQIHAVVYRSMAQMTHVLSLHQEARDRLLALIEKPSNRDFPTNYGILFHIAQRDGRVAARSDLKIGVSPTADSNVFCYGVRPRPDSPVPKCPEGAYRVNITRGLEDEPIFKAIPKELWVEEPD